MNSMRDEQLLADDTDGSVALKLKVGRGCSWGLVWSSDLGLWVEHDALYIVSASRESHFTSD